MFNRFSVTTLIFIVSFCCEATAKVVKSPGICESDEHWVASHSRVRNGQTEFVRGHCRANPNGFQFWNPRIRDGKPSAWPWKQERSKKFSNRERERLLDALGKVPGELWLKYLDGIYRMEISKDGKTNPATSGGKMIVLYDNAFNAKTNLLRVIVHELAHEVYRAMSPLELDSYMMATGWRTPPTGMKGWIQRKDGYVASDGKFSPAEDFANNVEYFLFEAQKLKRTTPHAFRWIEKYFGDKFKLGKNYR